MRQQLDSEGIIWCGEKKGETETEDGEGKGKAENPGCFCDSLFNELIPFLLSFFISLCSC
jgi:hypothetical protein